MLCVELGLNYVLKLLILILIGKLFYIKPYFYIAYDLAPPCGAKVQFNSNWPFYPMPKWENVSRSHIKKRNFGFRERNAGSFKTQQKVIPMFKVRQRSAINGTRTMEDKISHTQLSLFSRYFFQKVLKYFKRRVAMVKVLRKKVDG